MKKSVFSIALVVLALTAYAQQNNPPLFIGMYSKIKGDCSDRVWIREPVKDRVEYDTREAKFLEEHKGFSPRTRFVREGQCVIISQYQTDRSYINCKPIGYTAFVRDTYEECKREFDADVKLYTENRSVQPVIVYNSCKGTNPDPHKNEICCDALPDVLISEAGVYFWRLPDGCYKAITKAEYEAARKLPTAEERKHHIQICTGDTVIWYDAKPFWE